MRQRPQSGRAGRSGWCHYRKSASLIRSPRWRWRARRAESSGRPLAIYCGSYAAWAEATDAIQKYGMMIKSPSGFPIQSPYVAIQNRNADIMLQIAKEFGFTPAARSRNFSYNKSNSMLLLTKTEEESDELKSLASALR